MKMPDERKIGYAIVGVGVMSVVYLLLRNRLGKPASEAPGKARSKALVEKLHPNVQSLAYKLLDAAWEEKIPLVVTQSLRTDAEQQALYDQGRTKPGSIVTNARPGTSWHNYGVAFDVAVINQAGKPDWPEDAALWAKIAAIGKKLGLAWGGDFKTIVDKPHFEYHPGLTLAEAQAGKKLPVS